MALNEYRPGTAFPGVFGQAFDQSGPAWPQPLRGPAGHAAGRLGRRRDHPHRGHRLGDRLAGGHRPATASYPTAARSSTGQLMNLAPVTS
jgi:hypothetical protein